MMPRGAHGAVTGLYSLSRGLGTSLGPLSGPMAMLAVVAAVWNASARAAEAETYGEAFNFLVAHTKVIQLTGENGERVAICPEYQGRVMTSTTQDLEGLSHGWVNREYITRGTIDKHFNNYGGEDRLWLAPEGGPYSLFFAPGAAQSLANWYTPVGLNEGAFQITSKDTDPHYRLSRRVRLQNAARTVFDLEIHREIHLQKIHHFGKLFGSEAQSAVADAKLRMVGFQTINTVTNLGAAMSRDKGLFAVWSLGSFRPDRGRRSSFPTKSPMIRRSDQSSTPITSAPCRPSGCGSIRKPSGSRATASSAPRSASDKPGRNLSPARSTWRTACSRSCTIRCRTTPRSTAT